MVRDGVGGERNGKSHHSFNSNFVVLFIICSTVNWYLKAAWNVVASQNSTSAFLTLEWESECYDEELFPLEYQRNCCCFFFVFNSALLLLLPQLSRVVAIAAAVIYAHSFIITAAAAIKAHLHCWCCRHHRHWLWFRLKCSLKINANILIATRYSTIEEWGRAREQHCVCVWARETTWILQKCVYINIYFNGILCRANWVYSCSQLCVYVGACMLVCRLYAFYTVAPVYPLRPRPSPVLLRIEFLRSIN